MKIEEGKYYVNRGGGIRGPLEGSSEPDYPFIEYTHGQSWASGGRYLAGGPEDKCDLIREATAEEIRDGRAVDLPAGPIETGPLCAGTPPPQSLTGWKLTLPDGKEITGAADVPLHIAMVGDLATITVGPEATEGGE